MVNIFVDPVIIMTPSDNESKAEIEVWLSNLNIWLKEALTSPYFWLHSVQATYHLQSNERFPSFELLRNWQRTYQLDLNSVQLVKNVNEFFRNEDFDLKYNLDKLEYVFEFPLLFTPDDLLPIINVIELWAKGEKGAVYVIDRQFKKDWQETVPQPLVFHIGSDFIESVNNAGLDTNDIILRRIVKAAAAVIADQAEHIKGYQFHRLRESKAADSPQRIRSSDNAKARRLMIGKHGAGWRMHYWQIPTQHGSIIEFSNVVKESDDTIYE